MWPNDVHSCLKENVSCWEKVEHGIFSFQQSVPPISPCAFISPVPTTSHRQRHPVLLNSILSPRPHDQFVILVRPENMRDVKTIYFTWKNNTLKWTKFKIYHVQKAFGNFPKSGEYRVIDKWSLLVFFIPTVCSRMPDLIDGRLKCIFINNFLIQFSILISCCLLWFVHWNIKLFFPKCFTEIASPYVSHPILHLLSCSPKTKNSWFLAIILHGQEGANYLVLTNQLIKDTRTWEWEILSEESWTSCCSMNWLVKLMGFLPHFTHNSKSWACTYLPTLKDDFEICCLPISLCACRMLLTCVSLSAFSPYKGEEFC